MSHSTFVTRNSPGAFCNNSHSITTPCQYTFLTHRRSERDPDWISKSDWSIELFQAQPAADNLPNLKLRKTPGIIRAVGARQFVTTRIFEPCVCPADYLWLRVFVHFSKDFFTLYSNRPDRSSHMGPIGSQNGVWIIIIIYLFHSYAAVSPT